MKKYFFVLFITFCLMLTFAACDSSVSNDKDVDREDNETETSESDGTASDNLSSDDIFGDDLFDDDSSESGSTNPNRDNLPNQYETKSYYFRQGYSTDWRISLSAVDGKLVEEYVDQGLALQLVPGNETSGVCYNVFCNWAKPISMTYDADDIAMMIMDIDGKLAFNKINYVEPRYEYIQTSTSAVERVYNKMMWRQVEFSFINGDGDQCKGVWNLLVDGTNFYIVSYEATADKFDIYYADFEEMVNDFKKIGFEKE